MNNTHSPHTSQLIHAAVELVVGACITFWLNRKISTVSQKVGILEDKLKFYENILGQHHELFKKLFALMENTSGAPKIAKSPVESFKTPDPTHTLLETLLPVGSAEGSATAGSAEPLSETNKEEIADSMAALDAILSNEIKDIKIDRTVSLT